MVSRFFGISAIALAICFLLSGNKTPIAIGQEENGLMTGKHLPGLFYPFVLNGPKKERYRCLINDKAVGTFVLVFIQSNVVPEPMPKFLEGLNAQLRAFEKTPGKPTSGIIVFINQDLQSVVKDDEKREKAVLALNAAVDGSKFVVTGADNKPRETLVLGLDDPMDVKAYSLDGNNLATFVLCENLQVKAIKTVSPEKGTLEGLETAFKELLQSSPPKK